MDKAEHMPIRSIPEPSLRRLPAYVGVLKEFGRRGLTAVSCTMLAEKLGQDPTQIRKDLSAAGATGRPRVGFLTGELIDTLVDFLGWNNTSDAFLVGAGSLGTALLGHEAFVANGLRIVCAFDIDPAKIGRSIHGKPVFELAKLANLTRRMGVVIGVVTTPEAAAQETADTLVACGIRGIWNFTPARLQTPDNVVVENAALTASLGVLVNRLTRVLQIHPPPPPPAPARHSRRNHG